MGVANSQQQVKQPVSSQPSTHFRGSPFARMAHCSHCSFTHIIILDGFNKVIHLEGRMNDWVLWKCA